ncbi:MAG: hypothetical protein IKB03_02785 [Tidjanibacter sp.]|nr:hypothetical protein [Tidjanibacter sp.]
MKRFYYNLLAVVALSALAVACQEPDEKMTTSIEIQTEVTAPIEGGSITLEYTIENPVEGATLTATNSTTEWVDDVRIEEGTISFFVENNLTKGAEARSCSFDLEYDARTLATITVSQDAARSGSFTIETGQLTPATIDVKVTATNDQMSYICSIAPRSFIEENGGLEEYALFTANYYRESVYGDILNDYLRVGTYEEVITINNAPEEPMWLWVAGISRADDEQGTPVLTSDPVYYEFMFLAVPDITVDDYSLEFESDDCGEQVIVCNVVNAYDGGEITWQLTDNGETWLHNFRVVDGNLHFDLDANEYPVERSCELYVDYSFASSTCQISIYQAPCEENSNVEFELAIKELHYDRVVVDCTPSDPEVKYAIWAVAKDDFESTPFNGDPTKIPTYDLSQSYFRPEIHTGNVENYTLTHIAYSYCTEWYVYAYAVNDAENAAISEVKMILVELVDDRPVIVWTDERVTSTSSSNTLSVDNTEQTFTISYDVLNDHAEGVVVVEESYDDTLVKGADGKRVKHDAEARTLTFTVSANTTKRARTTYIYLKYLSSADDTSSDANSSLKISQSR